MRYAELVTVLLEAKLARGEISTAKGRRTWTDAQTLHPVPYFGDRDIESIKRRDIEEWKTRLAVQVRAGKLSPNTVNGRLRVLLSTLRSAVFEYEIAYALRRRAGGSYIRLIRVTRGASPAGRGHRARRITRLPPTG